MNDGLEALKELREYWLNHLPLSVKDGLRIVKVLEKNLKALEIIKEKNVFVWGFIHRKEEIKHFEQTYDYYKNHYGYFHSGHKFELLNEEEFNLLKEVLL